MRIKNKEINARRHRKEQKIKEAMREIRAQYGDKKETKSSSAKQPAKATTAKKAAPAAKKKGDA